MNFKKGYRVKRTTGNTGTVVANPVGVGYTVRWDNSDRIQRIQDGTLRPICEKR